MDIPNDAVEVTGQEVTETNPVEPSTTETKQVENVEEVSDLPVDSPFHKHPAWIARSQKIKEAKAEAAQYKAELEELKKGTQKVEPEKPRSEMTQAEKDYFDGIESKLSKSDYSDYNEFYKDVTSQMYKDLVAANNRDKQAAKEAEEAKQTEIQSQLDSIKEEIGDEAYPEFETYANALVAKAEEVGRVLDLNSIYVAYLNSGYQKKEEVSEDQPTPEPKVPSKVSKSTKPSNIGRPRELTEKELAVLDFHDVVKV